MTGEDGSPIGIGVLGAADIARRRAIPAIRAGRGLRLVAVASRRAETAQAFADEFGCDAVTGYERLLRRDDVQAVYIPLPNSLHEEWSLAALEAGKHVLVEKSLTVDAAAARKLHATARERNLAFVENFTFLHHTQHRRVADLVAEGAVGTPQAFSASLGIPAADPGLIRYRRDLAGGTLRENGCYTVRAAGLYLGDGVEVLGARLREDAGTGVDVAGSVLLADRTGLTAQCDFGLSHHYRNTYAIWGSEGRVELDWAFTPPAGTRPVLRLQRAGVQEERTLDAADQFRLAMEAFAEACAAPARHTRYADDAVRQAELLEAVVGAARATAPTAP
jgi:predicted dehydrogenase